MVDVVLSRRQGVGDGIGGGDGFFDLLEVVEAAVADHGANQRHLFRGAALDNPDLGQGGLALRQVVADVFTQLVAVALVVEGVIGELEGHAQVVPVAGQLVA